MAKERKISILLLLRDRLTKPITASGRAMRTFRNNARLLGQTLGPLTGRIAGLAAAFAGLQTIRKSLSLARVQVQAQAQLGIALRDNTEAFDKLINRAAEFQSQTTIGDEEFIKQAATLAISLRETGFEMARLGDVTATTFQVAAATGRTATRIARQLIETITLGRVSEEISKFFPQLADLSEESLRAGGAFRILGEALGEREENTLGTNAIVACVPKTSIPAARGYARAVKRPFCTTLIRRNTGIKRTFILPTKEQRQQACDAKFEYDAARIRGATIYLVDDSIVRGTTMTSVVAKLRACGAVAVHLRIPSPIIRSPCYFGIDMATREEMISYPDLDEAAIAKRLGVESVRYLPIEEMKRVLDTHVCTSCFTGKYKKELFDW